MEAFLEPESKAASILRKHYDRLYNAIITPYDVARKLYSERILAEDVFNKIESTQMPYDEMKRAILSAVRRVVHCKHECLRVFASVLLKFTDTVPVANAILKEYSKYCYIC